MARSSRLLLWALLALPTPSLCGSMAAGWTDMGPSFVMQNASTGLLTHSLCHSNNTPIYPMDPPVSFQTTYAPKNGTSLAAAGWFDSKTTWASLFYQKNNDDIVNAVYTCDFQTGAYKHVESSVTSDRAGTPAVHPETGLSVTLLGEQEGYRVFFHDRAKALQHLKFTQVENWSYGGPVSTNTNRSGMAIHSTFSGVRNVTVVTPRDSSNMEVSRLNIDGTWHISTFPTPLRGTNITNLSNATSFPYADTTTLTPTTPLESWSGNPKAFGLAIDTLLTRHIFYIGLDRLPHTLSTYVTATPSSDSSSDSSPDKESEWRPQPAQDQSRWPLADNPSSDFAIASQLGTSSIRLYYLGGGGGGGGGGVGGRVVEAKYTGGRWDVAGGLDAFNSSSSGGGVGGFGEGGGEGGKQGGGGLTAGQKAGVGVGVGVGVLGVGVAVVMWRWWVVRRRMRTRGGAGVDGLGMGEVGPMGMAGGQEGVVWSGMVQRGGEMSQDPAKWAGDFKALPVTPPPRELEGPSLASELSSGVRREMNITELP